MATVDDARDNRATRRRDRRARRLHARECLWHLSGMERVRECGRRGVLPGGAVRVRASGSGDDRRSGFAGLSTCGSVWACPVCAEKVLARRSEEVRRALGTWTGLAGRFAFVTLTMRHHKGQRLSDLWDALSYAWGAVTSDRRWRATVARLGVEGWLRVVETTHGEKGWHVHVHAAVLLPVGATVDQVDDLGGSMFASWAAALKRRNLSALASASEWHLWDAGTLGDGGELAGYFTKNEYVTAVDTRAAALELTRADLKRGRLGNRTPFQILGDLLDQGDADDLDLWEEWERASKGRRQLTWSRGLRSRLLADPELSDEEIAAEEVGTADDDLVEIPAEGWRTVAALGLSAAILDAAEADDDGATLRRYLSARSVPWRDVRASVSP